MDPLNELPSGHQVSMIHKNNKKTRLLCIISEDRRRRSSDSFEFACDLVLEDPESVLSRASFELDIYQLKNVILVFNTNKRGIHTLKREGGLRPEIKRPHRATWLKYTIFSADPTTKERGTVTD